MAEDDLPAMLDAQRQIYPDYQEDRAVFAERLALFPAGCLVLQGEHGLAGYALSHPWKAGTPVKLNTLLGRLPARPSTYYLHDIGLRAEARGSGAGARVVELLSAVARAAGLETMSLVAVQGSSSYWQRHGLVAQPSPPELASYGGEAVFMVRQL